MKDDLLEKQKLRVKYAKERYACFNCRHLKVAQIYTDDDCKIPGIVCELWFMGNTAFDVCHSQLPKKTSLKG